MADSAHNRYLYNERLRIWEPHGTSEFAYSDGQHQESYLFDLFSQDIDLSTRSQDLEKYVRDWPSEYHLSSLRHNLLRPFQMSAFASILEIGCGCGTITRQLGESGSLVHALDGSQKRASIAALRCRDLPNVKVFADNFDQFLTDQRYDLITLIGVLEYSPMFFNSPHCVESLLQKCSSLLKPDGVLLIAIENQLGLKYLNGIPEDHIGRPFYGVQDLYDKQTPITFGKGQLTKTLSDHGFQHHQFFYPFPDYKMTSLLLSEAACKNDSFRAGELMHRMLSPSYHTPFCVLSFDETLAWHTVGENKLISELSNSFLVFASPNRQDPAPTTRPWLAQYFSGGLADKMSTLTTFLEGEDGIMVEKSAVELITPKDVSAFPFSRNLAPQPYVSGTQYDNLLTKILVRDGDISEISEWIRPWLNLLLSSSTEKFSFPKEALIPGNFVDCTPWNLVIDSKSAIHYVDPEWTCLQPIPIVWVLIRGVCYCIQFRSVKGCLQGFTYKAAIKELLSPLGIYLSESDFELALDWERKLLSSRAQSQIDPEVLSRTLHSKIEDTQVLGRTLQKTLAELKKELGKAEHNNEVLASDCLKHQTEISSLRKQLQQSQELSARLDRHSSYVLELSLREKTLCLNNERNSFFLPQSVQAAKHQYPCHSHILRRLAPSMLTSISELLVKKSGYLLEMHLGRIAMMAAIYLIRNSSLVNKQYFSFVLDRTGTSESLFYYTILQKPSLPSQEISPIPLFDTAYYLQMNPDVSNFQGHPFLHFILFGAKERRDPHPFFDTKWYLSMVSEWIASLSDQTQVALQTEAFKQHTPLSHYLEIGCKFGLSPHPLFSPKYYREQWPEIKDFNAPPLAHYAAVGVLSRKSPHPLFDTEYYLSNYPDVAQAGVDPFVHFLLHGAKELRNPHPLFDSKWYAKTYLVDEKQFVNPLIHYIQKGASLGHNPSPLFDSVFYLASQPDLQASGENPLIHYALNGLVEKSSPHPLFDAEYYCRENPEVEKMQINPLAHWVRFGIKKDARPTLLLGPTHYFDQQPCLSRSAMNPIHHYQHIGLKEGRCINGFRLSPSSLRVAETLRISNLPSPLEKSLECISFLNHSNPAVSIVIPVYNQIAYTLRCLNTLSKNADKTSYEIIVIDDCSSDSTQTILPQIPGIKYIRNETNLGFLRSCNKAALSAKGQYILLLNNDTCPISGWLDKLLATFTTFPDAGLVGAKLLFPNGRLQEAGGIIWSDASGWNYGKFQHPEDPRFNYVREVDYCSGACALLPMTLWKQLGGFDETFAPAYYEDTDLSFRVRQAGKRVLYQPLSEIIHFEGVSCGKSLSAGVKKHQVTNCRKFRERWKEKLDCHSSENDLKKGYLNRKHHSQVLFIDGCTPTPDLDSGSGDIFNYMKIFLSLGYGVTFIPGDNFLYFGRYTEQLQQMGVECIYAPFNFSVEEYLKKEGQRFDLVLLYRAPFAARNLDIVRRYSPQAKVVFDTVDLHFLREQRQGEINNDPVLMTQAKLTKELELRTISQSNATIVLSDAEHSIVKELLPEANIHTIPIVREVPGTSVPFEKRKDLLFLGGFAHTPNLDAVLYFLKEVWPQVSSQLPDCNFIIAGSNPPPQVRSFASNRIIVRGFVPDLQELFDSVRLSVAPLRFGAGAKGKVVSSLCYGVPCVATSVAAEGMCLSHRNTILAADKPSDFVALIQEAYQDSALWNHVSASGIAFAENNFSVPAISQKIQGLIDSVCLREGVGIAI